MDLQHPVFKKLDKEKEVVEKEEKEDGMVVEEKTEVEKKEGELMKGERKKWRSSHRRSEEAKKRRRVVANGKLKRKHQAKHDGKPLPSAKPDGEQVNSGGKNLPLPKTSNAKGQEKHGKNLPPQTIRVKQRPTPSGQDYVVAITVDGRPASEEYRLAQMAALAYAMAAAQSSSSQPPVNLWDSRVENGVILLWCDSAASQEAVLGMLCNQEGIRVEPWGGSRRLVCGVPNYMANSPGKLIIQLLEKQNPELPCGSLEFVSLHNGPQATILVDADESAQKYLEAHNFKLSTITTEVSMRPVAEGKPTLK